MSERPDFEKLANTAVAEELSVNECRSLAEVMEVAHYRDGQMLINERGSEHTLFVLVDGNIEVLSSKEGTNSVVYTMTPGEIAGTRAFVDRSPRKAGLRAKGDVTVYTLEPHDFEGLLDTQPRILYKVMRGLFRIAHTNLLRMNLHSEQLANYISHSGGRY